MFRHPESPTANAASILLIALDPDAAEVYDTGLSLEGFRPRAATDRGAGDHSLANSPRTV